MTDVQAPSVPAGPVRRGNARRREWALCRLDRGTAYVLTFDRFRYRWEVEALPAEVAPSGGVGDTSAASATTRPPAPPSPA